MTQQAHIRRPTVVISALGVVGAEQAPASFEAVPQSETKRRTVLCTPMRCIAIVAPQPTVAASAPVEVTPIAEAAAETPTEIQTGAEPPSFGFASRLFPRLFMAEVVTRKTLPNILNGMPLGTQPYGWLNAYMTSPWNKGLIMARRDIGDEFIDATDMPCLGVSGRAHYNEKTRAMRPVYRLDASHQFGDDVDLVITHPPQDRFLVDRLIIQWWQEDPTKDDSDLRLKFPSNRAQFVCDINGCVTAPRVRIPQAMSKPTFIVVYDPLAT